MIDWLLFQQHAPRFRNEQDFISAYAESWIAVPRNPQIKK
ncbi:hypothetical protein BSUBE1_1861 [Bacillus subtilis E1]|nr:hypothetical protein BSUBE1_1861 [Bacillus subtilis E1]